MSDERAAAPKKLDLARPKPAAPAEEKDAAELLARVGQDARRDPERFLAEARVEDGGE